MRENCRVRMGMRMRMRRRRGRAKVKLKLKSRRIGQSVKPRQRARAQAICRGGLQRACSHALGLVSPPSLGFLSCAAAVEERPAAASLDQAVARQNLFLETGSLVHWTVPTAFFSVCSQS